MATDNYNPYGKIDKAKLESCKKRIAEGKKLQPEDIDKYELRKYILLSSGIEIVDIIANAYYLGYSDGVGAAKADTQANNQQAN